MGCAQSSVPTFNSYDMINQTEICTILCIVAELQKVTWALIHLNMGSWF